MAFTLHWPNIYSHRYQENDRWYKSKLLYSLLKDRMCVLTPTLSIQSDVLYPNALASVRDSGSSTFPHPAAPGCVGNQIDNSFPFESRIPVALPFVMYPTKANGTSYNELDICALPVLNWEKYTKRVRSSAAASANYGYFFHDKKRRKFQQISCVGTEVVKTEEVHASKVDRSSSALDASVGETQEETEKDKELPIIKKRKVENEVMSTWVKDAADQIFSGDPREDPEREERDPLDTKGLRRYKLKTKLPKIIRIPLRAPRKTDIVPSTYRKYLNSPKVRITGTWNYLYGGVGACNWIHDSKNKQLFVGNGPKLRMVTIKAAKPGQILSYAVGSIWEEDQIPSNVNSAQPEPEDPLNNQIFEIKTLRRRHQIAVRRGKSIEIYIQNETPSLIASIPNVCYGNSRYHGPGNRKPYNPSPFLTSFDMNENFPSELVTIDENAVIQFIDVELGKAVSQFKGFKTFRHSSSSETYYEKVPLNDCCGVSYVGGHPDVVYYWAESNIYLHDRRTKPNPPQTTELINLRSSVSSASLSDQYSFQSLRKKELNECISSFASSRNPLHYYFGTSGRVFLMDIRVPKNPIIKCSHGLVSPPAYMDVAADDNYEVLVCGSQRSSETFCLVLDTAHIACMDRTDCQKRNPILYSYPTHLSNSRELFGFTSETGLGCSWESDVQRMKAHCYAWMTGLCLMKATKCPSKGSLPTPFILFHGNCFGDVFVQEWDQKPISPSRKVERTDERLVSCIKEWSSSMQSPLSEYTPFSGTRSIDCSPLIESVARIIETSGSVRQKPFDPFTPHDLTYQRVRDGLPSVENQLKDVKVKSKRAQSLLDVWITGRKQENEVQILGSQTSDTLDPSGPSLDCNLDTQIKQEVIQEYEPQLTTMEEDWFSYRA